MLQQSCTINHKTMSRMRALKEVDVKQSTVKTINNRLTAVKGNRMACSKFIYSLNILLYNDGTSRI